jgi:hypothetical protein
MPNNATIKRAARGGARFLQAATEDYSAGRQFNNDMALAIAMLKVAPVFFQWVPHMIGFMEAGLLEPADRRAIDALNDALARGLDRKQGNLL